jgi:hypothetical protein
MAKIKIFERIKTPGRLSILRRNCFNTKRIAVLLNHPTAK